MLLKYFDQQGFVFFTNFESRKALEIEGNPQVSLLFVWLELERQVMINGTASKISAAESAKYFMSRPKESQMAAWVSSQSHPLSSKQILMQKFQEMKTKIGEGKVPLPSFWGGYRVEPWRSSSGRAAKTGCTTVFSIPERGAATWTIDRLAP